MTLYIATFKIETTQYMGDTKTSDQQIRLIRAEHVDDAEDKLNFEVERHDPYGTSRSVVDLEITACIT